MVWSTGRVPTSRLSRSFKNNRVFLVARDCRGHSAHALVGRHESFRQRAVQRPRRHDGQGGVHGGHERGTRRRTGTSRLRRDGLILHCFPRAVGTPRVSRPARPRLPATVDGAPGRRAHRDAETTRVLESGAFPRASVRAAKRRFRLGARRRSSAHPTFAAFETDLLPSSDYSPYSPASRRGHQPRLRGRARGGAAPWRGRRPIWTPVLSCASFPRSI